MNMLSIARPRGAWLAAAILLAAGSRTGRAAPSSLIQAVPGDRIPSFDAASGPGALHVVWQVEQGGTARDRAGVYYVRRTEGTWSPPRRLATGDGGLVRLVAHDGELVLMIGRRLRVLGSTDHGVTWVARGDLLTPADPPAAAVDMLWRSDASATVAYRAGTHGPDGGPDAGRVFVLQYPSAAGHAVRALDDEPPTVVPGPPPRMARGPADRAHLAVAQTVLTPSERGTTSVASLALWTEDGRGQWTRVLLVPPRTLGGAVAGVALLADADHEPVLFWTARGLWSATPASAPRSLAVTASALVGARAETGEVAAVAFGERLYVAWIDARFRRSDRRWWNPLGGFPWSDDPDWINNDVLLAEIDRARLHSQPIEPERVTSGTGFARDVRLVRDGDCLHVLWSGRKTVGKHLDDRRDSDGVFHVNRALIQGASCGSDRDTYGVTRTEVP